MARGRRLLEGPSEQARALSGGAAYSRAASPRRWAEAGAARGETREQRAWWPIVRKHRRDWFTTPSSATGWV